MIEQSIVHLPELVKDIDRPCPFILCTYLEDVEAEAHVIAFLDDVRVIALRALEVLDHHPEILTGLVDVPIPVPGPGGAKGLQEPAERGKEDKGVDQALDRGRAMLQRWSRPS